MLKAKPPRPKNCKHCKTQFQPARNFVSWCSVECAVEIAKAKQAKQKANSQHFGNGLRGTGLGDACRN